MKELSNIQQTQHELLSYIISIVAIQLVNSTCNATCVLNLVLLHFTMTQKLPILFYSQSSPPFKLTNIVIQYTKILSMRKHISTCILMTAYTYIILLTCKTYMDIVCVCLRSRF